MLMFTTIGSGGRRLLHGGKLRHTKLSAAEGPPRMIQLRVPARTGREGVAPVPVQPPGRVSAGFASRWLTTYLSNLQADNFQPNGE